MQIESTSISCGVRRLVIGNNEKPSKEELVSLIKSNKSYCAMVMTSIPTRRTEIISLLLENGFEQVKNPSVKAPSRDTDNSIHFGFCDMAMLIMKHGEQIIPDDSIKSEQFVANTINVNMTDIATLMLHHGNELIGNYNFFIHYN